MTELRQDPTTNEWVIIARERAKRPYDFVARKENESVPAFVEDCPFCPGNERLTPPEVAVYRRDLDPLNWAIRIVPNMYPALTPDDVAGGNLDEPHFKAMDGFGFHEVVIESPLHNQTLSTMDVSDVNLILRAYQDRYRVLSKKANVKLIITFKNHGTKAGTSLFHPHSQIVAAPVVSNYVNQKRTVAKEYYEKKDRCVYCDINGWEVESCNRLVSETPKFIVFHPYASRYPFETWISPKTHNACFANICSEDMSELAEVLHKTIMKIDNVLGKPDFNYIVHTAPVEDENADFLHWYIQMVPRIWIAAGFEIGSGVYINSSIPEETAKFMKEINE